MFGDHAGRHLVDFGHRLFHAHVVDGAFEASILARAVCTATSAPSPGFL
jgi:hypothetical protein